MSLGKVAQTIVEEALELVNTTKHCYDNVTLMIISLKDYWQDYRMQMTKTILCQDL